MSGVFMWTCQSYLLVIWKLMSKVTLPYCFCIINIHIYKNIIMEIQMKNILKHYPTKGLFIWAEVTPVNEKTFRQVYERDLALLRK
jgi:hypothetical protein